MPKLLYTWYFEKFTGSVTSSGHSALRHEVSRMCTILFTLFIFLAFLSLIFINRHASIKKPVKIVDYCDFPLQNVN